MFWWYIGIYPSNLLEALYKTRSLHRTIGVRPFGGRDGGLKPQVRAASGVVRIIWRRHWRTSIAVCFFVIMLQINVICLDLCTNFVLRSDHGEHPGHAPASWWVCLARVRRTFPPCARFSAFNAVTPDRLGFGYGCSSDCGRTSVRHATAALLIRPAP